MFYLARFTKEELYLNPILNGPIPALDGSKVVFCLIEWIFRKPVPRKIEAIIHSVGFVLILLFAVVVDILQFAKC